MKRSGLVIVLCAMLTKSAVAAPPPRSVAPPAGAPPAAAAPASPASVSARKQLEALLQSPANLDFDKRKQVTIGELLDQLHERHQLSIRFDAPTLFALLGGPPASPPGVTFPGAVAYLPGQVFSVPGVSGTPASAYPARIQVGVPQAVEFTSPPSAEPAAVLAAAPPPDVPPSAGPTSALPATLPPVASSPQPAAPAVALPTPGPLPVAAPEALPSPSPVPAAVPPSDPNSYSTPATPPAAKSVEPADMHEILAGLLKMEIDIQNLDLARVSVATVLRHALDAAPTSKDLDVGGMPIPLTQAATLDYLVENDGLLITTRMKALTTKETRVYSTRHLADSPPEQLAKVIRQSVRPWSWRAQINDLGDQLKGAPLPAEMLTSLLKSGVQLAGAEVGVSVNPSPAEGETGEPKKASAADETRQMEMVGNALVNGLVTFVQATVSTLEMVHHGEPPTGTIQTLGGKLVVTQSQAAHREIAELLKQLAEE